MLSNYVAPAFIGDAFTCPLCGTYSHFIWEEFFLRNFQSKTVEGRCSRCRGITIWLKEEKLMLWPRDTGNAPLPNVDIPEEIKKDYLEARSICNQSPRGAAALIRLAIQKLCIHLGETGKNINADIGNLVKKGLPVQVQQALDIVRVTGNNAVHPGEMQLGDDQETVSSLFQLLNLIVENQISQPKAISEMYGKFPGGALKGIQDRDGTAVSS